MHKLTLATVLALALVALTRLIDPPSIGTDLKFPIHRSDFHEYTSMSSRIRIMWTVL